MLAIITNVNIIFCLFQIHRLTKEDNNKHFEASHISLFFPFLMDNYFSVVKKSSESHVLPIC